MTSQSNNMTPRWHDFWNMISPEWSDNFLICSLQSFLLQKLQTTVGSVSPMMQSNLTIKVLSKIQMLFVSREKVLWALNASFTRLLRICCFFISQKIMLNLDYPMLNDPFFLPVWEWSILRSESVRHLFPNTVKVVWYLTFCIVWYQRWISG